MSIVRIKNSIPDGEVTIPPSKSVAHRALICSFLAGGGAVHPIIDSDDMTATRGAIMALINGDSTVDCIESGSTLRFMIPVATALGRSVTFIGRGRLPQRPIGDYLRLLPEHGVSCVCDGGLPLTVSGRLTGGRYEIAGDVSSQYITGLLLALPILDEDSDIILTTELQSKPYVDMTVAVMADYGVLIDETDYGYHIRGGQRYSVRDYSVESDWSQAAFFLAAAAIGGCVTLHGLDMSSTQGDKKIIDILAQFGADITVDESSINCRHSALHGIEIDATDIPDMVPSVAIVAAFAQGKTTITGAERLRFKESDRISSVVSNLRKMGVAVDEKQDAMVIYGSDVTSAEIDGCNDHRIVMAFAVAGMFASGETVISDAESINKSYPAFFDDYNSIGGNADVISDR